MQPDPPARAHRGRDTPGAASRALARAQERIRALERPCRGVWLAARAATFVAWGEATTPVDNRGPDLWINHP